MKVKKIASLAMGLGLILTTGGAITSSYAAETVVNTSISSISTVNMNEFYAILHNEIFKTQLLAFIYGTAIIANKALMQEKVKELSESPNAFERELAIKCENNPKFAVNLIKFFNYCQTPEHKENYEKYMSKRPIMLRTPPSYR